MRGILGAMLCAIGAGNLAAKTLNCPADAEPELRISRMDIPRDAPKFSDYPAQGMPLRHVAQPDVHSTAIGRMYRTRIRWAAKEGPNFAGHYTLMAFGAGAGAMAWAIEDAVNGRVMAIPGMAQTSNWHVDSSLLDENMATMKNQNHGSVVFRKDSRLIQVFGSINEDPTLEGLSYFVWTGTTLKRIRFVPIRVHCVSSVTGDAVD